MLSTDQQTGRSAPPARRRPLVLVVDDDPGEREIYCQILWYNGYDVACAPDADAAILALLEHRPDLVLLDLVLPGLDGIELVRRLRDDLSLAGVPVIAISGRRENEWGDRIRKAGFLRYLEKPVSPVTVLHAVEHAAGRAPPAGEEMPEPGAGAAD